MTILETRASWDLVSSRGGDGIAAALGPVESVAEGLLSRPGGRPLAPRTAPAPGLAPWPPTGSNTTPEARRTAEGERTARPCRGCILALVLFYV